MPKWLLWDCCYHGGKGCPYFEPIWYKIVDESELACATAVPSFYHITGCCVHKPGNDVAFLAV